MAAGPWYIGSGIGDANIAVARRTIIAALDVSVKNGEIMGHPVIRDLLARDQGLGQLMGELGVSTSLLTIGTGSLAATAEGTEATPTNFSTANSTTVSPARKAYARQMSDFGRAIQEGLLSGALTNTALGMIVYEAMRLWVNQIVNMIVAFASTATYTIGTTAVALSWGALQEGIIDMKNRGVRGRGLALISAKGAKDLTGDLLSLGGAVQWAAQSQGAIQTMDDGAFLGTFNGVDFYLNSELDADGGDTLGILLTAGALQLKHQRVRLSQAAIGIVDTGFFTVEMRRPGGGIDILETASYNSAAILEQARFAAIRHVT